MFFRAGEIALERGVKPVQIPSGCISILHFTNFRDFSTFGYKFRGIPNLYYLEFTVWRISHFSLRPGLLCVLAPLSCFFFGVRVLSVLQCGPIM